MADLSFIHHVMLSLTLAFISNVVLGLFGSALSRVPLRSEESRFSLELLIMFPFGCYASLALFTGNCLLYLLHCLVYMLS